MLFDLLFSHYDKDVRPNHGVGPLDMEVDLYVESFANIAEANMEYTLFGYFRHYWTDKRLANKSREIIHLKGSTIEHAWLPDTYISNSRQSNLRQKDSEAESSLFLYPNGAIFYSKGVKIVASCAMDLKDFPMDTQKCGLSLGSYGHSSADVEYKWKRDNIVVEKKNIAQFDMTEASTDRNVMSYVSGNYTQLLVSFHFERRIGYYVNQVYIPDTLIVTISWIVFWLGQDDMGGRVGLGITTLLTIMFLLGSVNMSLPRVSYAKAIDWYLIVSFVFVFLVLFECIIVYVFCQRKRSREESGRDRSLELEEGKTERARIGDSLYIEKLLKNDGFVNVEMLSNNSELTIVSSRNNVNSFLPEKKSDIEMTESLVEDGLIDCQISPSIHSFIHSFIHSSISQSVG
ncbi:Gamma-aminobutyric acid receptor subunit beta-3 [Stylophora pistillata]|uniref:Gamma-aminobutyric acid receptor subunit beta-3 n=1 Tax=Stylophora pistillata TaxID=50429 RepID=A0A2B4RR98_STYPI|nr:Gamma-aminobutyric acid receptor subunit beta-3 [Stylophora pistillata]